MSVKYKIEDAKINKQLKGDIVTVSKVKPNGGRGPKGPKQPTTRQILVDFIKEQKEFNNSVKEQFKFIDEQFKAHG
ncbi:MAG: hypothetical protein MJ223_02695 [Mycoplasmoidaceae bacterium]|nr:hypothetical protein [Mycoplasmoidaceae bacterium]